MQRGNPIGVLILTLTVIVMVALLPSCRREPTISNQVVVTGIGMKRQNGRYQLSIQAVDALRTVGNLSEQSENATAVYHAESMSVAQALQEFLNETGRSTYILHNQIISLGMEDYKDQSLFQSLDYFVRNLEGRSLVDLIICRSNPADLLTIESGNDAIPSEYISQLLKEGNDWGIAVNTRLLDVQRAFGGMFDAVLPIMSVEEKIPRLDGTALFRNGFFVGELSVQETTGLLFAANQINKCLYTVDGITFRVSHVKTDLHIERYDGQWRYGFTIEGRADIVETDRSLKNKKTEKGVWMEQLEASIVKDVTSAIEKSVKVYGCDPLALARRTAKADKNVAAEQVKEQLSNADFFVNATIRLTESGLLS